MKNILPSNTKKTFFKTTVCDISNNNHIWHDNTTVYLPDGVTVEHKYVQKLKESTAAVCEHETDI